VRRSALAGAALLAVLAGCASVPRSGPVHVGRALPGGLGEQVGSIGGRPSGPVEGMSPQQLVNAFLDAQADAADGFAVARTFLAPGASWNPRAGTTIYDDASFRVTRTGPRTVVIDANRTGVIDSRGDYQASPGAVRWRFVLARSAGQWRISHLPSGALVGSEDAARALEPVSVYYLNQTQTAVVAEPLVLSLDEQGFATRLVQELLDGPGAGIAPAVTSAIPRNTSLQGNVTIDSDGVAELNLIVSGPQLSSSQLERLSAQVVWTLRQASGVTAVRILVNGALVAPEGVIRTQPILSWAMFDPSVPPPQAGTLFLRSGRVVGHELTVPAALRGGGITAVAMGADGARVAALRGAGVSTLLVGPAAGPLTSALRAASYTPPAFDPAGDVYLARRSQGVSTLLEVPVHGRPHSVPVAARIRRAGIDAVAVSRDGTRIALVTGGVGEEQLRVGLITGDGARPAVTRPRVVLAGGRAVSGVAWANGTEIATTASTRSGGRRVVVVSVDGYTTRTLPGAGLRGSPTEVAALPGHPTLAGAGGAIWAFSAHRWRRLSTGSAPAYAG